MESSTVYHSQAELLISGLRFCNQSSHSTTIESTSTASWACRTTWPRWHRLTSSSSVVCTRSVTAQLWHHCQCCGSARADWTTRLTLYSPVCRTRLSHHCSVSSTLLCSWCICMIYEDWGITSRTAPWSCTGWRSTCRYSTKCVCLCNGHWTTLPSCCSTSSNFPQGIQVCGQPTRIPCSSHKHHWSMASGRSLVPQLETAYQQTSGH